MSAEHEQELYGDDLGMGDYNEGQEIPVGGNNGGDEQMGQQGGESDTQELEAMKKRLKEMEEEAAKLKASQQQQGTGTPGPAGSDAAATPTDEAKAEADSRSIYVGNVDYSCTPEELQQHFQSCGTVNRVTILTDKGGNPKGFAYVEFLEIDAVSNAILLDSTELRGRQIKVTQKRTNRPGLKQRGRGRGRGGFSPYGRGGFFPYPYPPMPFPMPMPFPTRGGYGYGFGYAPRGRGRGRGFYSPY